MDQMQICHANFLRQCLLYSGCLSGMADNITLYTKFIDTRQRAGRQACLGRGGPIILRLHLGLAGPSLMQQGCQTGGGGEAGRGRGGMAQWRSRKGEGGGEQQYQNTTQKLKTTAVLLMSLYLIVK